MCENFLHDGGSLFIGVYALGAAGEALADERRFVAFSYGFVGVKDKEIAFKKIENLRFYSQYTGIRDEFRGFGLGAAIKEFQRDKVRDLFGIDTITCTYDPLTGVNAWRNVHHFGMRVEDYRVSTYGEYGGLLNRLDVPSDRFFMAWDLSRPAVPGESPWASAFTGDLAVVRCREEIVAGRSGPVELEILAGVELEPKAEIISSGSPGISMPCCGRPMSAVPMSARSPSAGGQGRGGCSWLFFRGYAVADFFSTPVRRPENYYVLRRTDAEG